MDMLTFDCCGHIVPVFALVLRVKADEDLTFDRFTPLTDSVNSRLSLPVSPDGIGELSHVYRPGIRDLEAAHPRARVPQLCERGWRVGGVVARQAPGGR